MCRHMNLSIPFGPMRFIIINYVGVIMMNSVFYFLMQMNIFQDFEVTEPYVDRIVHPKKAHKSTMKF